MSPEDVRHGTEAGHEQHIRDGEPTCLLCLDAKTLASRRRGKRKTMGYRYTLPIGEQYARIADWRAAGATYGDLADHTGLAESRVWEIFNAGPEGIVYARTFHAIKAAPNRCPVTALGVTRRIQGLTWLGYSVRAIADASGAHGDTILDARNEPRAFVARKVRDGVVDAYDRLHMTPATGDTRQHRAGVSRARNLAVRKGYHPPLAWVSIDDVRESPTDWAYIPPTRAEAFAELVEQRVTVSTACRVLKVSRDALEKWCDRWGLRAEFNAMNARETAVFEQRNQWSA